MMPFINKLQRDFQVILLTLCSFASQHAWSLLAIDDNYIVPQDSPGVVIDPLANDIISLASLVPLTSDNFTLQSGQGSMSAGPGGIVITPAPGFVGQIVFAYRVTDVTGSDTAKIIVDVQASAAPHQAVDDFHHVLENDIPIGFNVLANDNFSVSNGVQIIAVSTPANGGIVAIDPGSQFVTYQPPANYTGSDTFTYDLQDQVTAATSQAQVTVLVGINPGQNLPIAGASNEEQNTIDVIDQICNDFPNGALPCTLIATLTDTQRRLLAQQVGGRHAKAQSRAMRQIKNRQGANLRLRLTEIRTQQNRVSVNNLNTVVYNDQVPLGKAFQPVINDKLSGGSAGDENIATPWGVFINGNVNFGEGSSSNDRPQYEQNGFNLTSGMDYRISDRLILGGALGYSTSNLDFSFNRGNQNSDSYSLSLFGNFYPTANLYLDFLAMWVNADIDINRRINIATFTQSLDSNTTSQQIVAATSFGYEFSVAAWQGSLYARAEYSTLEIDAYTESGSGSFELTVGEQQSNTLDFAVGGRVAYAFPLRRGVIMPSLEVETVSQGEEEFAIESRFAQISAEQTLRVDAEDQDDSYYNASLSLSAVWRGGRSGFFRYETLLGHDEYKSDSFSLGFRFEF